MKVLFIDGPACGQIRDLPDPAAMPFVFEDTGSNEPGSRVATYQMRKAVLFGQVIRLATLATDAAEADSAAFGLLVTDLGKAVVDQAATEAAAQRSLYLGPAGDAAL